MKLRSHLQHPTKLHELVQVLPITFLPAAQELAQPLKRPVLSQLLPDGDHPCRSLESKSFADRAVLVILLHDLLGKSWDVSGPLLRVPVPRDVQEVADVVVVDRVLSKLQSLGADQIQKPGQDVSEPERGWVSQLTQLCLIVRDHSLRRSNRDKLGGVVSVYVMGQLIFFETEAACCCSML